MQNTDMIAWFVKDSMGSSKDLYSEGYGAPDSDAQSNIDDETKPFFDTTIQKMNFVTRRKLDTGDSAKDYVFNLESDTIMCYAYKIGTTDFSKKHEETGLWSLRVESNGQVTEATGLDLSNLLR